MATLEIPVNAGLLNWTQETILDDETYTLDFRINRTDGLWRMSITRAGTLLVANLALTGGVDLLAQHKHNPLVPQGELRIVSLDAENTDPTELSLGDRHVLVYIEPS